ncbi:InlB B-repeat-containing protein, partial [Hominifimenecus microfluidus]|uniref:InlB B-repeat-containing protein n=1 Tax=Hominifimenecus microfluidus TaxID=2885348 RepID=UPI0032BF7CD2
EQFTLAPGGTYYFDLSAMGIPGTVNDALPDKTMRYVPFTYAGTVDSYKLTSEMATTEEYAQQSKYAHSLFIADFAVTHEVSWDNLNTADLIFGKNYTAGGVDYTMRAPSAGSDSTGSGDSEHGTPQSNEWDRILDKNDGYIKNWSRMHSWGQDTSLFAWENRVIRGSYSARYWTGSRPANSRPTLGFRPVLEILNSGTLGSDGLKAVTLDLGGGKLGNSFKDIQIIVKSGDAFTAPSGDGLTRPDGNIGSYFKWLGSDGELYAPGESVPAVVTKLSAQFSLPEQFTLTPGSTYYFDLSGVGIPGTANGSLPDASLHYVPFTYAGTVDAYKLTSEMVTTEEYAEQNQYPHSLFVANFAVTHTVNWNALNDASLIFGKNYAAGGVDYMLRAPSAGSDSTGSGDSEHGTPQSNEWDRILDKNGGYIKNWVEMFSWGQDSEDASFRAVRGYFSARYWISYATTDSAPNLGFSPVLEVLNPGTLGSDGLKVVTLDLGGGKLGSNSDHIQIIVKKGESFTAPASDGLTRPDGNTGSYFKWLGSDGKLYVPGGSVPANVNKLTAQFDYTEQFTLDPGGTYYFDLSGVNIPGTVNDALPDKTMHYVPFTYAGTVDAYKLTSEMVTTEEYAAQNKFAHSLFMADYAVTHTVSWNDLNTADLIFGKDCAAGGVEYMLRAPSVGSGGTGWDDLESATPQSNEWDKTLDKYDGYIKNWSWMHSWGQDTESIFASGRAVRGYGSARGWYDDGATVSSPRVGFRPVLEVLNPGTLGSDGLKAVTLDLGGGKLGNSSEDIQIIVKNGKSFTAPASEGLTRPDGNTGNYFKWRGSDGELYAPDDNVPADVTKLTAQFDEQFTLAPGGTYYFDLSGESIPGTADDALPDKTMHYVPFTYAGTVDAYKLTSAMAATDEYAEKNKYAHSLFVADYTVTHTVSWDELNAGRLIFGRDYAAGGVDYILRAPSVGSGSIGSAESQRGTPPSNEWDRILDKNDGYIRNWFGMFSWGQDTLSTSESDRAARGYFPPGGWSSAPASHQNAVAGFRPVLEVLSPGSLGSDGLKAVTLDLDGGKLGNSSEDIQIIVKSGESFAAPASDGLTRPDGNTGSYFMWRDNDGQLYAPGDNVPADVTKLTAQFAPSSHSVTITTDTLPDGKVGEAYSQILTATGTTPIKWSISGELPKGLTLKETTGEISGTPTADGTAKFTVTAENSVGSDTKELSITITKAPAAEYTVTVTTEGGGTASASPAKAVAGAEITLTAMPNEGYHFKEWQVISGGVSIKNNKFTMPNNNVEVKAIFEEDTPPAPTEHTVTVTSGGNGTASASPAKAVAGAEITLSATPDKGYHLKEWEVESPTGLVITNNKFLMPDSNVEVKAIFEEDAPPAPTEFTITVKTDGNGTASASPAKAVAGTEITLTAMPNEGYHFKEWQVISGGVAIENNKFLMPDSNVEVKAIFEEDAPPAPTEHTVTVTSSGNGTASASPSKAVAGAEITLTATPDKGYHLKEWQVISGDVTIVDDKFTMPDSNVEVKAVFEEDAPPAPTDPAKPSISVTGAYTYNGSEHTAAVNGYDPTTMDISGNTATDAGDYTVRVTSKTGKWADGSTDAVTAAWSIGKATQEAPNGLTGVAPTTEGGSDGKITGVDSTMEYRMAGESSYTACCGTEIENLSAGNYFVRYAEDNNHFAGTDAEVTVGKGAPLADCTITFDGNGGSGSMGPVTVKAGANYILPECGFTAPADQEFKAWEISGTEYKVGDSYTVNGDIEIKALWKNSVITPTTYTVTVGNDGNGTGTAAPSTAAAGTTITLTATPNTGYHLKEWKVISGNVTIKDDKFTMPNDNVEVKAIFEKDAPPAPTEFIVTFDGNGGTPSVGSMTTTDQKLTSLPSASRSGSYSFDGWYTEKSGGTKITTDTVFHANTTVYAHWTYTGGGGGGYNPPVTYYTLRFETGSGSDIPSVRESYNTYIDLTKYVPTWRGHTFIGWYSERSLMNKVSGVYLTKDMTVYAGWRVDENPNTGANPFTDVSEKDWFYSDVMFVYENGLMLGTSETLFSPHETATRGMMATILWRMEGSPAPKGKNSFTDVEAGKWYADAITWTAENGIFAGYGKDKFGPDDPITREQLAAIFYRYADYKGYDLTVKGNLDKFKDADKITDYAKTAMQWAVDSGLMKGKSGNLLDPQGTATRAEIAAMLHRFIEKYELVQGKAPGGRMGWMDPKQLQLPKTGDSSVLGLWGISLCTSLAGCLALTAWKIRRRE